MQKLCNEVYVKMMEEFKTKTDSKGNFTWFNFDRSVKVEVSIADRIDFDDLTITACKDKLDEFLDQNLDSKQEFVKQLVTDAFSTSRGKLDAKKVMSLLKYRTKIKSDLFQEALNLLESAIRRPDSRTYFRIWERDKSGEYKLIDLNFSSI
jgi:tRNA nucleotidyltransferase/poly(A) polymerase